MYALELAFDDVNDERRLAARADHRDRLAQLHRRGLLVMCGPWEDGTGALLIFRTDEEGMRDILDADPYYSMPGVTVVSSRPWAPIIGT
jgi:uncharacterized protein YciI